MTVVARGHVGSDIGFTQGHGFTVVSVPVMDEAILVAPAAPLVAYSFKMAVDRRFDFMGVMTVRADRAFAFAFGQQLSVHTLVVNLLHFDVAFTARFRNVGVVNR